MRAVFSRVTVSLLGIIMLWLFAACGSSPEELSPTGTAAAFPEIPASDTHFAAASIEADGRIYTFEDASGQSVPQLLEQAGITLNEGDILSLIPDQAGPGQLSLRVLRQHCVSVVIVDQDAAHSRKHTVTLMEGTVADAIAAAGVELAENHAVNLPLNSPLADGMQIVVSGESFVWEPAVTDPTEPPSGSTDPTEPSAGQSEKTIISIEIYEDCDGSGHGIKVITYSDGTQEEVLF